VVLGKKCAAPARWSAGEWLLTTPQTASVKISLQILTHHDPPTLSTTRPIQNVLKKHTTLNGPYSENRGIAIRI
jgi:hypothetical protein